MIAHATVEFRSVRSIVFDAYGTLFNFNSAVDSCRDDLGDSWAPLAEIWRIKQLEYTWLRSIMGNYVPFTQITADALDYAMSTLNMDDAGLRSRLLELYLTPEPYPVSVQVLEKLRESGLTTAVLSNGSPDMLNAAVESAGLTELLDAVLSVDAVRCFKPHPSVYQLACDRFDCGAGEIAFVSANPWDASGAASFGFRVIWINRVGIEFDRLPGRPAAEVGSLSNIPLLLKAT